MRSLVWLIALVGCATLPDHRPLVVDNVPYGADRAAVRGWHFAHHWCLRAELPTSDAFMQCNPFPYVNATTPTMISMIAYDEAGLSTSYAVFVPVPCRLQGGCDVLEGRSSFNPDHEFVEPGVGLYPGLAERGRALDRGEATLPDMQERLYDALRTEIAGRSKLHHTWVDPHGFGETWETAVTEVGLFVSSNGAWIIETHEIKPGLRATNPAHAHPAGTFVSL